MSDTAFGRADLVVSLHGNSSLCFEDGDVVVRLALWASSWLVVHSAALRRIPGLAPLVQDKWTSPEAVTHPKTKKEVKVFSLAIKFIDGTFLLYKGNVGISYTPNSGPEAHHLQDVKQSIEESEKEGAVPIQESCLSTGDWPELCGYDSISPYSAIDEYPHAFKAIFAIMHDMDVDLETLVQYSMGGRRSTD